MPSATDKTVPINSVMAAAMPLAKPAEVLAENASPASLTSAQPVPEGEAVLGLQQQALKKQQVMMDPVALAEAPDFVAALDTQPDPVKVQPPAQLLNASEKTDAGLDQEGHLKAWSLQLATFADKNNAARLKGKLLSQGYTVYTLETLSRSGRSLYRVLIGPELRFEVLTELKDLLQEEIGLAGIIVRFKS